MVNINLNIQKKDLWLLSAIMIFLVGTGIVIAYNSGASPNVMGHSAEEINFDPPDINAMGWGDESTGEVEFPNGLIMKWGIVDPPAQIEYYVSFASQGLTDFPNAGFQVFLTGAQMSTGSGSSNDRQINVINVDKTGFTIYGHGVLVGWPHRWLAIGR